MSPLTSLAHLRREWEEFWHEPLRAERLALTRILLGVALLSDQLFQYLPHLDEFFGPEGVSPAGLYEWYALRYWQWPALLFHTDDPATVQTLFWLWVGVTAAFTLGFCTRLANLALWVLTYAFLTRTPPILNAGDSVLKVGVFWLLLSPCGRTLSLDALLWRRATGPTTVPAWPVRLIQLQLCFLYLSTGLSKLFRVSEPFVGTWWDGTSLHYVLNDVTMSRWSYTQLPLPLWLTAPATWVSVWWEVLFPLLVLSRHTRAFALWFGVLFHLGIWLTIEVGWFSFYTVALYGVWVPDSFWRRWDAWRAGANAVSIPASGIK
jgi:hypothetical protein